jgi:hypothetical protein
LSRVRKPSAREGYCPFCNLIVAVVVRKEEGRVMKAHYSSYAARYAEKYTPGTKEWTASLQRDGAWCKGSNLPPYPMPDNPVDPLSYLESNDGV